MTKSLNHIALIVALGGGMAFAQGMGQQQPSGTTPPTLPSSQQQTPPTTDQSPNSPSSTSPSTAPDQTKDQGTMKTDKDDQNAKLPQTDAGPTSSASVKSSIESALKQDPSLASDNLKVKVSDKKVNLSGKVNTDDEKQKAEQIASTNAGGRTVDNHIKVTAKNSAPDKDKDKTKSQSNPY